MAFYIKGLIKTDGVWGQGDNDCVWTKEEDSNRNVEKIW
jgi:hypothetical protein